METIVQTRGPLTAYSLSRLTGMKKSKVNAVLYGDLRFVKTEQRPLSRVNPRPVWTWSPVAVPRTNRKPVKEEEL
jgi:hypothetical protein